MDNLPRQLSNILSSHFKKQSNKDGDLNHSRQLSSLSSSASNQLQQQQDNYKIEIFQALRLTLQHLIDNHIGTGIPVTDESTDLQFLLRLLDRMFQHGLLVRRPWHLISSNDYWSVIVDFTAKCQQSVAAVRELMDTVNAIDGLRTSPAKLRAWLSVSLVRQNFASTLNHLITDHGDTVISEHYEPWSLIRSNELMVQLMALFDALDSIQFNLYLRAKDLESPLTDSATLLAALSSKYPSSLTMTSLNIVHNNNINNNETESMKKQDEKSEELNLSALLATSSQQVDYLQGLVERYQDDIATLQKTNTDLQQQLLAKDELVNRLELELNQLRQSPITHATETSSTSNDLIKENQLLQKRVELLDSQQKEQERKYLDTMEILKATQVRLVTAIKSKDTLQNQLKALESELSQLRQQSQS